MSETTTNPQQESPSIGIEELKAAFEKSNMRQQAILKLASMLGIILNDKRPMTPELDSIRGDAIAAAIHMMACDVACSVLERLMDAPERLPMRTAIALMGVIECDGAERHRKKLINLMEAYDPSLKEPAQEQAHGQS